MGNRDLHSAKPENVLAVLEIVARCKHITKARIAEETGLSLMTVGRIIESLGSHGILLHRKTAEHKLGRRAEEYCVRKNWLIPVFFVTSGTYKFYISDLEGNVLDKIEYGGSKDSMDVPCDFIWFMRETLALLKKKYRNKKALGIGVAIAGTYDETADTVRTAAMPELSRFHLMSNIRKIFKKNNIVIHNANRLCAESILESIPDREKRCISCLMISDVIECTTCDHGHYINGGGLAGRFGDLPHTPGVSNSNYIRYAAGTDEIFDLTVDLLKTVSAAYDPDKIYLCSDKFRYTPLFTNRVRNVLKTQMLWVHEPPEVTFVNATELEAVSAIISELIRKWLDEILKTGE